LICPIAILTGIWLEILGLSALPAVVSSLELIILYYGHIDLSIDIFIKYMFP